MKIKKSREIIFERHEIKRIHITRRLNEPIFIAPSEIKNATGIASLFGGLSEFFVSVGAAAMKIATGISNAMRVITACLEFDRVFIACSCRFEDMAAMTTIIKSLPDAFFRH